MPHDEDTIWGQPLSFLPQLAWVLDGMAESAAEQVDNLRAVQDRPGALDDATLDQVLASYTQQHDDLWLYDKQLRRWQAGPHTDAQQTEIARLTEHLGTLRADIETLLNLGEQLRPQMIGALMGMSDAEVGLAFLSGKLQPPRAATPPQPYSKTPRGKKT